MHDKNITISSAGSACDKMAARCWHRPPLASSADNI